MVKSQWVRVRPDLPCAICGRKRFCTRTTDGKTARCMKIESPKPCRTAMGGWFHNVGDPIPVQPEKEPVKIKDVGAIARKMYHDPLAAEKRQELAASLGVTVASLEALRVGIGWDHDGEEFASFPSMDADCRITGITRRYFDGSKKTLAGTSNSGIFVPMNWWTYPGPVLIVEGASDVAALISHQIACLGRPSNVGGAKIILAYLRRRTQSRAVYVVGENDRKPGRVGTIAQCAADCFGCSFCFPGKFGAIKTAYQLKCKWFIPPEGIKDVREWSKKENFRKEIEARCSEAGSKDR